MKTKVCGCRHDCDCSEQPPVAAPQSVVNPAGENALSCRVGTHSTFFEELQRRLSSSEYPELKKLHTRKLSDPSIALLDAWATVGDVLTFYNERFINEGYLRTATEHRSLAELSGLIGYRPGPGVASSVYLAFTLQKAPQQSTEETMIPKGTAVKSVPGDKELPQTFETAEDLVGRPEWNAIRPRQTIPQDIGEETVYQVNSITVGGITTRLVPNDLIVFAFPDGKHVQRYVLRVETNAEFNSTTVWLKRTKYSTQQFVDDVRSALAAFQTGMQSTTSEFHFNQTLFNQSTKYSDSLSPQSSLIKLDTSIDTQIPVWKGQLKSIVSVKQKTADLHTLFKEKIAAFLNSVTSDLKPLINQFLSDQDNLAEVVAILKEAWGDASSGNGGISDNIAVNEMRKKVRTAIEDQTSGITQIVEGWPAGVLRDTGEKLLEDLDGISNETDTDDENETDSASEKKQFRTAFLTAWATFTDQSNGAFDSKRNGTPDTDYQSGKYETLVKMHLKKMALDDEPDFVDVADAVKDAQRTSANHPEGWLVMTGLTADSKPVEMRLQYQFVNSSNNDKSNDSLGPVPAQGLFNRLVNKLLENHPPIVDKFKELEDILNQLVNKVKNSSINNPEPAFEDLKKDIQSIIDQTHALSTSTDIGMFAAPLKKVSDDCRKLNSIMNSSIQSLKTLDEHVLKLLKVVRVNFVDDCNKFLSAFGDPAEWSRNDEKANSAKKNVLDPFKKYINKDVESVSLQAKVESDSETKSLNKVVEILSTTEFVPTEDTPYQSRYHLLLQSMQQMQKQVSSHGLNSRKQSPDDLFPEAVGLVDALESLLSRGQRKSSLSSRKLTEVLNFTLKEDHGEIPDLYRQIVSGLSPQVKENLTAIWRQIRSQRIAPRILAFKTMIPLFGYNAPKKSIISPSSKEENSVEKSKREVILEEFTWKDIKEQGFSEDSNLYRRWRDGNAVYLSQPVEGTASGSVIIFRNPPEDDRLCLVEDVKSPVQPGVLNVSAPGSLIELVDNGGTWHKAEVKVEEGDEGDNNDEKDNQSIKLLRKTTALVQSQELNLVEVPVTNVVKDNVNRHIELDGLYPELKSGQTIIIVGERFYIDGAKTSEIATIKYVRHALVDRAGDKVHTRIILTTPLKHSYKRDTVTISANVVRATHGETVVKEIIGSGDASQSFQSMPLNKGPLTHLPAPTVSGVASTLSVRVNELLWHEKESLIDSTACSRHYVVKKHEANPDVVQFGNGITGARLPTGHQNVSAEYRVGLGVAGNVKAGKITQIAGNRPLGLKDVNNPLPATGGADPETTEQIRLNAPLAVMALDRLVSVRDYADFALNYAGIEKASAKCLTVSGQSTVHITIAGADDLPITTDSDLFMNLLKSFRKYGDPQLTVKVDVRELLLIFISARVRLLPDYAWEFVESAIRERLYTAFSFRNRNLAQDLYLSEVLSTIQQVEGVAYVDIDVLNTLSQSAFENALQKNTIDKNQATSPTSDSDKPDNSLERVFKELSDTTELPKPVVPVYDARLETDQTGNYRILSAQIASLSHEVPDSLFLSEIMK
ncbi:putative baseplate assembly protein [Gimesia algae]|uniref:Baseplate J-like protein n=1 Tax=Gimesia algae TaxID=2527971 RepID=A0A517VBS6_9PLAN|nr:putative baseplate assembly protein [Gimesia algae]QDT90462.1 Baseplate J-like protein [Gimesia algae]